MLKGFLGAEVQQGGITVRRLYFECPTHGKDCPLLYQSIPVTRGKSTMVKMYESASPENVWGYVEAEMPNKIQVSPSIDASKTPCGYHTSNPVEFMLVPRKEDL